MTSPASNTCGVVSLKIIMPASLRDQLECVTQQTGLDESSLVRAFVMALYDHVQAHGRVRLPLVIRRPE